jgi:hypothetical protein
MEVSLPCSQDPILSHLNLVHVLSKTQFRLFFHLRIYLSSGLFPSCFPNKTHSTFNPHDMKFKLLPYYNSDLKRYLTWWIHPNTRQNNLWLAIYMDLRKCWSLFKKWNSTNNFVHCLLGPEISSVFNRTFVLDSVFPRGILCSAGLK